VRIPFPFPYLERFRVDLSLVVPAAGCKEVGMDELHDRPKALLRVDRHAAVGTAAAATHLIEIESLVLLCAVMSRRWQNSKTHTRAEKLRSLYKMPLYT
jgi:hypothetical protein